MPNEIKVVNGFVVGHHFGTPMQDATPAKPEDNEPYVAEKNTVTHNTPPEEILEKQPVPMTGGASSWHDLTDKPFYEETAFEPIVWDGNTEGLECIPIEAEGVSSGYRKVADYAPVTDKFDIESMGLCNLAYGEAMVQSISDWDRSYGRYMPFEITENGWSAYGMVVASNGNFSPAHLSDVVFPAGIWFMYNDDAYVSEITAAVVATPLDDKYLSKQVRLASGLNVIVEESEDGTLTADKTYGEIMSVIESGGRVTLTLKHNNGVYSGYNLLHVDSIGIAFSNVYLEYSMGYVTVEFLECCENGNITSDLWRLKTRTFALFDYRVD